MKQARCRSGLQVGQLAQVDFDMFDGVFPPREGRKRRLVPIESQRTQLAADEPQVYVSLEKPLQVNLVATGKRMPYLNLDLWLAVKSEEDAKKLEGVMPKVIDQFQVYLRSLRIDDLQGADGVQRMRDELLMRAKSAAKPIEVEDVLIKSMLAQ